MVWALIIVPSLFLGLRGGAAGVAAAWAIAYPAIYIASAAIVCSSLKTSMRIMLVPLAIPALAALISSGAAASVPLLVATSVSPVTSLLLQICIGAATYVLTFRILSRERFMEIRNLIVRLVKR
jgi:hypothetical protein